MVVANWRDQQLAVVADSIAVNHKGKSSKSVFSLMGSALGDDRRPKKFLDLVQSNTAVHYFVQALRHLVLVMYYVLLSFLIVVLASEVVRLFLRALTVETSISISTLTET